MVQLYQYLAKTIAWNPLSDTWQDEKDRRIAKIMFLAPSGSGFDAGTKLDDSSTGEKIVFNTAFHHMDENGFYVGWTQHRVTVRPSLAYEFKITVSGRDRNDIKNYIHDCFNNFLRQEICEKTF